MGTSTQSTIEKLLDPLMKEREGLSKELEALMEKAEEKKTEIRKVDKILRAGGLLEPQKHSPRHFPSASRSISDSTKEKVLALAQSLSGPFTIRDITEAGGPKDGTQVKNALEAWRGLGKIRLVGRRHHEKTGHTAVHWAVIANA